MLKSNPQREDLSFFPSFSSFTKVNYKEKNKQKTIKTSKIRKLTNSCDRYANRSLDEPNQFIWSWGLYVGESNRGDFEQI